MARTSRILIVDDELLNVDLLEQQLEELGYETVTARNGQEALDRVAEQAPDLILLDVMMPVMDGFTACRILKESEETHLIPIVIMTALNAVEDCVKGIEVGADEFLTKPVDERVLQARIRTALKQRHAVADKLREVGQVRDHYEKFVPEVVKRLVAENPDAPELGKQEQDASILFLDICGYTRLSQQLTPDVLNALTESYFSAFLDKIHEIGGDISETSGDGLMIIFHGSEPEAHARRAVDTAVALMRIADALNVKGAGPSIELHMGISSGVAAVGSTRFEGLRGTRWVYTADGLVPNLAARLAMAAKPHQLLVGAETARRVGDRYPFESMGGERLKNIAEPVEIHALLITPESVRHSP